MFFGDILLKYRGYSLMIEAGTRNTPNSSANVYNSEGDVMGAYYTGFGMNFQTGYVFKKMWETDITDLPSLKLKENEKSLVITGENFQIRFNRTTGNLESYQFKGIELIEKGPEPNFWRAPTDNDLGFKMQEISGVWRHAGKNRVLKNFAEKETSSN